MDTVTLASQMQKDLHLVVQPADDPVSVPALSSQLGDHVFKLGKMIRIDAADPKHVRQYFSLYGNHPVEHQFARGVCAEVVQSYQQMPNYRKTYRHSVHFAPTPETID